MERQRQILIPIASTMIVTLLVIPLVLLLGRRREAAEDASAEAEGDADVRAQQAR